MPSNIDAFAEQSTTIQGDSFADLWCALEDSSADGDCAESVQLNVPHVKQVDIWDCGVACVAMALKYAHHSPNSLRHLHHLCSTRSVWSIDLAHLLNRCGASVAFTTTYIGINPTYLKDSLPFYALLERDSERVNALFCKAAAAGIAVRCLSLELHQLKPVLFTRKYLIIILVDKWILSNRLENFKDAKTRTFAGHYIVLIGWDPTERAFLAHDPASNGAVQRISTAVLEKARKARGTDEDVLFIRAMPTLR